MATPHNSAEKGMIAKDVLMPGDPLRAKFIAESFLDRVICFNQVRNMYGYTGEYKGKPVSVMASGMGMPSMGIYSYELFTEYNVENIIRIGSAGSYCSEASVYDVILASEVYSESSYAKTMSGYDKDKVYPDRELNERLKNSAKSLGIPMLEGCIHSTDVFYRKGAKDYYKELYEDKGCMAVEMESFALLHNAALLGRRAACLVTVSDSFVTGVVTTAEERQNSFINMINIALNSVI